LVRSAVQAGVNFRVLRDDQFEFFDERYDHQDGFFDGQDRWVVDGRDAFLDALIKGNVELAEVLIEEADVDMNQLYKTYRVTSKNGLFGTIGSGTSYQYKYFSARKIFEHMVHRSNLVWERNKTTYEPVIEFLQAIEAKKISKSRT